MYMKENSLKPNLFPCMIARTLIQKILSNFQPGGRDIMTNGPSCARRSISLGKLCGKQKEEKKSMRQEGNGPMGHVAGLLYFEGLCRNVFTFKWPRRPNPTSDVVWPVFSLHQQIKQINTRHITGYTTGKQPHHLSTATLPHYAWNMLHLQVAAGGHRSDPESQMERVA